GLDAVRAGRIGNRRGGAGDLCAGQGQRPAGLMWRLIGTVAAVVALVAAVAGGLWKAYDLGREVERAKAAAVLAEWKASVAEQAAERRKAQREQLASLQGELDELRSRPEKVRTVTRTIRLKPDAECGSLSPDFKR